MTAQAPVDLAQCVLYKEILTNRRHDMDLLNAIRSFIKVVEAGSIAGGARAGA
jgi:hypothetical protein